MTNFISNNKCAILYIVYFFLLIFSHMFRRNYRLQGVLVMMDYYCLLCICHFRFIHSMYCEVNYKHYQCQQMYYSVQYTVYRIVNLKFYEPCVILKCVYNMADTFGCCVAIATQQPDVWYRLIPTAIYSSKRCS